MKSDIMNHPFQLPRLGVVMEPEPGNPMEAEGVLNPASARGRDGQLYLFPRLVAHSQFAEAALTQLGSAATGLSAQETAQRLTTNGPNELKEGKRINALQIFLGQFKSLIVWILIVAGIISGVLGKMVDAIVILAIVVLNAVIGFYQEHSAEKSIAALKKMAAPQTKVWPMALSRPFRRRRS